MALSEFKAEIDAAMQCLDQFIVFERGRDKAWATKTGSFKEWARSAWEKREIIHASGDKVHINTRFVRYRADGSVLGAFDSIYIVTKQDGHWGIKIRSSFAP